MLNTFKILAACGSGSGFLDVPTWYENLSCDGDGNPQITNINDVWAIMTGVIDFLLYLSGVVAVLFIIYGGIQFITSQGAPDKLSQARKTLIYAAAGLIISIAARAIVDFAVGQF